MEHLLREVVVGHQVSQKAVPEGPLQKFELGPPLFFVVLVPDFGNRLRHLLSGRALGVLEKLKSSIAKLNS